MVATTLVAASLKVTRGTYSKSPVCVTSAAGPFAETVSFGLASHSVVNMHPASITAGLGDASACG